MLLCALILGILGSLYVLALGRNRTVLDRVVICLYGIIVTLYSIVIILYSIIVALYGGVSIMILQGVLPRRTVRPGATHYTSFALILLSKELYR